jgi:hypothetical protein
VTRDFLDQSSRSTSTVVTGVDLHIVDKLIRLLAVLFLGALILGPAAVAAADDDEDDDEDGARPVLVTGTTTAISDRSATLTARVTPLNGTTFYRFEYGRTTSYGQSTPEWTLATSGTAKTVTATIQGLTPGAVYHVRVRAWNRNGTSIGNNRWFTTLAAPEPPAATPAPVPEPTTTPSPSSTTTPEPGTGATGDRPDAGVYGPPPAAAPEPELGRSMGIAPLEGSVRVKLPGSSDYATLAAGDSVPVGTVVDSRHGTIKLTSALAGGATQTAELRGALFQVRQDPAARGMTDIVLRGGNFAACPRRTVARAAAALGRKPPKRRLWARDKGGRFRTHGRNSVATVRGTAWVTTDTCAGTRTTVTEGAVAVRDQRRGKTVVVRAGHSYLARSAR